MSDRINIETKDHELYKILSEKSKEDPETSPFLLMKDLFMWAVAIGVSHKKRRPLAAGKENIFRWDQFSQNMDIPVLKAIALAETGDVNVLLDVDEIIRIAEEYANEGIRLLNFEINEKAGERLWNLANLSRVERKQNI